MVPEVGLFGIRVPHVSPNLRDNAVDVAEANLLTKRIPPTPETMPISRAHKSSHPRLERAHTNLSYCNGEILPGSSNITLYLVSPWTGPRHIAQTLQHLVKRFLETKNEAGEPREQDKASAGRTMSAIEIFRQRRKFIGPTASPNGQCVLSSPFQGEARCHRALVSSSTWFWFSRSVQFSTFSVFGMG